MMWKTILAMLVLLVLVVLMLGIRMLLVRDAEPRGTCSSNNPLMRGRGISCPVCGDDPAKCDNARE